MNHTYNITEIVGSSPNGTDQAIKNAVAEASKSLRNMAWFEVVSVRGNLDGDEVVRSALSTHESLVAGEVQASSYALGDVDGEPVTVGEGNTLRFTLTKA